MSLNDVISVIGTLVSISVPVVGALIYILTKKPDKRVIFIVSIVTVFVVACVLSIAIVISGATGGNKPPTAQSAGPANTETLVPPSVVIPSPPTIQVSEGDAASVMKNFCNDINSSNIQGAYGLTSSNYQTQHSITDFRNQFNDPDISQGGCLYDTPQVSSSTATVRLTFDKLDISNGTTSTATYAVTLIQDPQNNNEWRINSI